jgi:hypothetical protein
MLSRVEFGENLAILADWSHFLILLYLNIAFIFDAYRSNTVMRLQPDPKMLHYLEKVLMPIEAETKTKIDSLSLEIPNLENLLFASNSAKRKRDASKKPRQNQGRTRKPTPPTAQKPTTSTPRAGQRTQSHPEKKYCLILIIF